jgi:hypothetical protein
MFKRIIIFSLLVAIFLIVVSFFTRDIDIAKTQLTDKITGISQNPATDSATNLTPTSSAVTPNPTLTDQQVETELNSGAPVDVDLDSEFSNLETELNQL